MVKYNLNTGKGRITIEAPEKYKGKKVLPLVYKVRTDDKGRTFAVVGLYQRDKDSLSLIRNKVVYIKKR